jgi:membrane protein implicated in regulation of membrane protease activity
MIVSTLLGRVHRHGGAHGGGHGGGPSHGAGHGLGHSGAGHGLRIGHSGGAHGAGAGHAGAAAGHNGAGGHGAPSAGHSGAVAHGASAAGHNAGVGHGAAAAPAGGSSADLANPLATTGPIMTEPSGIITRALSNMHGLHVELKEESILESFLGLLNPLSIATFLTFFGLVGAIISIGFKLPAIVSLPVAAIAGWLAVHLVVGVIAWLFETMGSSSEARTEDLVGRMAEVTIPIAAGKIGEITYIIKSKRYASPARAVDPTLPLSKRTKVMISELQDHLLLVEPWTDSFIDPAFDSPQKART